MDDEELLRYSRQILLADFGIEGQQCLASARVLLIGLGGLGSPVAMYLAAAGVGHLCLSDFDRVDLSNLQRQIIHRNADIGRAKVDSARDALTDLNPLVRITTLDRRLQGEMLAEQVRLADVVVDGSDNFATRFAVNEACVAECKPLVSGAAIRMEGQISVFNRVPGSSPCYRCLYRNNGELDQSCSENGVLAPLVGIIGSMQAMETVKLLAGIGEVLDGRLLIFDGATMEWREVALRADPDCPVCGKVQPGA